jgi:hypothetical protein
MLMSRMKQASTSGSRFMKTLRDLLRQWRTEMKRDQERNALFVDGCPVPESIGGDEEKCSESHCDVWSAL